MKTFATSPLLHLFLLIFFSIRLTRYPSNHGLPGKNISILRTSERKRPSMLMASVASIHFPNGDTDKVNGCILVIFRRAKVASGPQMRDSLRLRHRRSPTSQSSRGTRPKRGTPWAPSPPTSLSRHHSPSFSPEDNCKNLLVPEMDGSGTIPTPYPLSLA